MGATQSITQEKKLEDINNLHNNIELLMQLNINDIQQLSTQNKKLIKSTLKELTNCTFYMQISREKLISCVNEHVLCWAKLNNVEIDNIIYAEKTYRHIEKLLDEYNSFTITF